MVRIDPHGYDLQRIQDLHDIGYALVSSHEDSGKIRTQTPVTLRGSGRIRVKPRKKTLPNERIDDQINEFTRLRASHRVARESSTEARRKTVHLGGRPP